MKITDLLFIVCALTTVVMLVVALVSAVRGNGGRAVRLLRLLLIGGVFYFFALIVNSLATPRRELKQGDEICSDDWCIRVVSTLRVPDEKADSADRADFLTVTLHLSSRAARVSQREKHVIATLRDYDNNYYRPVPDPSYVPFDTLLAPVETVVATRRYRVPPQAATFGIIISREGIGRFPGCCIIGDEESFFHKRTIVMLR